MTLWEKFQSAVRFARGVTSAAIAIVQGAPATQTPYDLGDHDADPTQESDGASIEGYRTINLYWSYNGAGTLDVQLWLFDGEEWYPQSTVTLDAGRGILDPFDTEGWQRIYAKRVSELSDPGDELKVKLFPHNEEG